MSLTSAIGNAVSGLANISQQMAVISNNIANAQTPNYAVEKGTQTALTAGGVGFGVLSGPVVREINLQLQAETFRQNAKVSGLQTQQTVLQPIDAVQGTPGANTDLGSKLGNLSNAFLSLQSDPSNAAAQSGVVSAAGALATQINTLSNAYQTARQNAEDNIVSGVTSLNATIKNISGLTDKIVAAQQSGQSTADLENQRDISMNAMSSMVSVSFISQPNGGLLAATSGGLAMTMSEPAPQFSVTSSTVSSQSYFTPPPAFGGIAAIMLNGADVTAQMTGGSIGTNIKLRDTTLPTYQGELDLFANTLQSRMTGQNLQLFTPPASALPTGYIGYASTIAVDPSVTKNPSLVRDGNYPAGASSNTNNLASFGDLISNVITFGFGANVSAGTPQTALIMTGLGALGTLSAPFASPTTLAGFASSLVASQSADVGTTASQLATESSVQTVLNAQVTNSSGVNTDNQLSNMVALQNAYGANARIITAAQAMWTQLITSIP